MDFASVHVHFGRSCGPVEMVRRDSSVMPFAGRVLVQISHHCWNQIGTQLINGQSSSHHPICRRSVEDFWGMGYILVLFVRFGGKVGCCCSLGGVGIKIQFDSLVA